jgi:hypothetical protein
MPMFALHFGQFLFIGYIETVEKVENRLFFRAAQTFDKTLDAFFASFSSVAHRVCEIFSLQSNSDRRFKIIVPHIASY